MLLVIPGLIYSDHILICLALILLIMGATFVIFPFPTPETTYSLGLRKSMFLVRSAGVCIMTAGILFSLLYAIW